MSIALATAATCRAALYARKSSEDRRNPGKSVRDQLREARAHAHANGWDVVGEYADDGISASRHSRRARPGFLALLTAVESGDVDAVVMAEQSRATRRLSVLGALVETCADHGVRLVVGGREVDPSEPADLVLVAVQGGMDAAESERAQRRTLRAMRGAAEAGTPHGKNVYGYRRVYDPDRAGVLLYVEPEPDEAAVVREIVSRLLAGHPLNVIARDLNDRCVPSPYDAVAARTGREPKGALWVGTQVRRVAQSPAYAALRVHQGKVVGDGAWPPIITRAEHERAAAILGAPERRRKGERPGALKHPLSGVAKCGVCGAGLRVLINRGKYRSYVCPRLGHVSRTAGPLEDYVRDVVLALVCRPGFVAAVAAQRDDGPARDAAAKVEEITSRREQVRAMVTSGALPVEDGAAMLRTLEADLDTAEREARRTVMPRSVADIVPNDLALRWESLPVAQRREIIDALVTVEVLPSGRHRTFDPATVCVTPKGAR